MHELLTFLAAHWLLCLIFGGTALDLIGETFDVGISALRKRAKARRAHQLELKRMELEIARANAGGFLVPPGSVIVPSGSAPKPGPCVHRNVTAVVSKLDEVLGWLCKTCGEQLPADWAVREEDL